MDNKRVITWFDVRDALPEKHDIYLLSSCGHPVSADIREAIEEEGDSVMIGLYEGNGKWRRRQIVYKAEKHITAWAEVPPGYRPHINFDSEEMTDGN